MQFCALIRNSLELFFSTISYTPAGQYLVSGLSYSWRFTLIGTDLSLIVKARSKGADYLHALLMGYQNPPRGTKVPEGMYYNKYYSGNLIAMPQPLYEDGVEYLDGTKATEKQMANDVTTFLAWASEPEMETRKRLGVTVISFLLVFSVLAYFSMKQIWAPIKKKV